MDIVSRKAILRDLLAEYRAHKEEAEREADRVRARIAEEVPVYADLSGAISGILLETSRRALEDPQNAQQIAQEGRQRVLRLQKEAEGALAAAGYSPEALRPRYHCPVCKDTGFVGSPCTNTAPASRSRSCAGSTTRPTSGTRRLKTSTCASSPTCRRRRPGKSQRQTMAAYRSYCEGYADAFPDVRRRNLLLTGRRAWARRICSTASRRGCWTAARPCCG